MDNTNLNRLKVILAEKDISNKTLAEMLGISQATVSKWVTNTTQPHLDMLIKLSRCLDVSVEELIRFPKDEVIQSKL
ncbi:MAG: helix-turn-helix transcriptional regulator [Bacteroidales bacterium]|nr:helix-turn-helix transcriptional regulator [Bacteroidales bacterium]